MKLFRMLREELLAIPLLIVMLGVVNYTFSWMFPTSAFFDFPSEIETLFKRGFDVVFNCSLAWLMLRIMLPSVFRFIKDEFYANFNSLDMKLKYILATVLLSVFILAANAQDNVRHELLQNLTEQLGVREVTSNSSPMIDQYLKHVGFDYPVPWCAAFVSWNLHQVGVDNPSSAWSPSFARDKDVIWFGKHGFKKGYSAAKCGDCVTFYYSRLGRVGHVGFYIKSDKSGYFITIEGNTNGGGSREGDGVYMKKRDPRKVYAISRYIKEV